MRRAGSPAAHLRLLLSPGPVRASVIAWQRPQGVPVFAVAASTGNRHLGDGPNLARRVPTGWPRTLSWGSSRSSSTLRQDPSPDFDSAGTASGEQAQFDGGKGVRGARTRREQHSRVVREEYHDPEGRQVRHTRMEVKEEMHVGWSRQHGQKGDEDPEPIDLADLNERASEPPLSVATRGPRRKAALQGAVPLQYRHRADAQVPRCVAYCVAESFDFDGLLKVRRRVPAARPSPAPAALSPRLRAQVLQREYVPSIYFSEVIHVAVPGASGHESDAFFFQDGCMVLWDVGDAPAARLLDAVAPCQRGTYPREEVLEVFSESIEFTHGAQVRARPLL
jgi:hypothetical protein